jgi:diguanylate cyclase (GGDEF)-like protein/PAS domain S-box-containing protein
VVVLDPNGINLWSNIQAGSIDKRLGWWGLGGGVGECYLNPYRIAAIDGDGYAAQALAGMQEVLRGRNDAYSMEYPCRLADESCWFRLEVTAFSGAQGAMVTLEEITHSKRMKQELKRCHVRIRQQDSRLFDLLGADAADWCQRFNEQVSNEYGLHQAAAVFANSSEAMIITDARRRIIQFNDALLEITGFAKEDIRGKDLDLIHADILGEDFNRSIWQTLEQEDHWQGEIWNRRWNGEPYPAWETIDLVRDDQGRLNHYVCLFSDITSIKASHNRLYYMAHHDSLTGLANRLLFWARLEQAMEHARRHRQRIALLFLDLDRFKQINDTHGHAIGDQLLQSVAQRLREQVRGEDTVARLGGDEFAVLAMGVGEPRDAQTLARKLELAITRPVQFQGVTIDPRTSIGIGLFPDHAQDAESLYQAADAAMYRVKQARRKSLG